jgi:hypothetical protein
MNRCTDGVFIELAENELIQQYEQQVKVDPQRVHDKEEHDEQQQEQQQQEEEGQYSPKMSSIGMDSQKDENDMLLQDNQQDSSHVEGLFKEESVEEDNQFLVETEVGWKRYMMVISVLLLSIYNVHLCISQ